MSDELLNRILDARATLENEGVNDFVVLLNRMKLRELMSDVSFLKIYDPCRKDGRNNFQLLGMDWVLNDSVEGWTVRGVRQEPDKQ